MRRISYFIATTLICISMLQTNVYTIENTDYTTARHLVSWQLSSGGWAKNMPNTYTRYWNGYEKIAYYYQQDQVTPLGTIDNDSTVKEIEFITEVNKTINDYWLEKSIIRGFNYLLTMQYESGGFPQVYPAQDAISSAYENNATFNDDAMINVMYLFQKVVNEDPAYMEVNFSTSQLEQIHDAYNKGIDFILKTQIESNGVKTIWGGQYDPVTLETTKGRPFEPVSLLARESVAIVQFLESLNSDNPEIIDAIESAKAWYFDVAVEDTAFKFGQTFGNLFEKCEGTPLWYRFYEIGTNKPIFGDSDGSVYYDLNKVSLEKKYGYGWAGNWAVDFYKETISILKDEDKTVALSNKFITKGKSYRGDEGFYFVDDGQGYSTIRTPYFKGVYKGDVFQVIMTISEADSMTSSNIYINNVGLRQERSEWKIGHGIKTKVIEFTVLQDFEIKDQYLEFVIKDGESGESILVSDLQIYVNDELKLR